MATNIKAIKCPQCGSTRQTGIRANYYRCNSCGTEFFIDNENDITVNHKFDVPNHAPQLKTVGIIVAAVIGSVFLLSILSSLLFSHKTKSNSYGAYTSAPAAPKEKTFKWDRTETFCFESANKQTIIVVVGTKDDDSRSDSKNILAGFYDAASGKEITKQELNILTKRFDADIKFRRFETGEIYCIINKKKLLTLDRQYVKIDEMPTDFKDIPDLESGIAQIEFVSDAYGDGFKILTNDGKERYYYPIIRKVYNKDQFYTANKGFATIPAQSPVKTAFTFSRKSFDYPEEKIQLIKYKYKSAIGYPRDSYGFEWRKDYGGAGIFTDASPYKKRLINDWQMQSARMISFSNFTPGRLYFNSKVLAYNDEVVIIAFRPSAAEDAPYSIQALDANTAQVLWTTPVEDKIYLYDDNSITGSGYYISGNSYDLFVDKNGKIIRKFKAGDL